MGERAAESIEQNKAEKSKNGKDWKAWLKEGAFYNYGLVYMLVRVAVNVTMTVQPFYLNKVTAYEATEDDPTPPPLALVPLLSYIMSMGFSIFLQRPMTRYLRNRMMPMLVAIFVILATSVPQYWLNKDNRNWIYPLNAFQGIGIAIMLNTATSLISDVIGNDSENSAFVYGCYSLFDKFANGILLYWIVSSYS